MPIMDGGSDTGITTETDKLSVLQQLLLDTQAQLQDDAGITWPGVDLLPYINLAIAEIIKIKPTAYPVTEDYQLIAGSKQLPGSDVLWIIDAICNVVGNDPGDAVTWLPRQTLDATLPDWQVGTTVAAQTTVLHTVRDEFDPYVFYVFPPQPAGTGHKLRMIFSILPSTLTSVDDNFPLDESYKLPVMNYVLYLALGEETTIPNAQQKSTARLSMFYLEMGVPMGQQGGGKSAA